jgi:hypothetical protein
MLPKEQQEQSGLDCVDKTPSATAATLSRQTPLLQQQPNKSFSTDSDRTSGLRGAACARFARSQGARNAGAAAAAAAAAAGRLQPRTRPAPARSPARPLAHSHTHTHPPAGGKETSL